MTEHRKALAERHCAPCQGKLVALETQQIERLSGELDSAWTIENGKSLTRSFRFKGFAKASYLANLCVWLADREGHHPDIAFGWGYCQITLTTHDIDGLSENDFIWAAQLDKLISSAAS
ncbi:MAG: 4a-hydroxytetrahydrobiopterin dehydratase [Granulosicoccus sp.]